MGNCVLCNHSNTFPIYIYIYIGKVSKWLNYKYVSQYIYIYIYMYIFIEINRTLAWWFECLPMPRETWVPSQVRSFQSLKKWYLMPPCLTLSIIRYGSRVKWCNPEKGVAPSPTPRCTTYRKGNLRVTLNFGRQLYLLYIYFFFIIHTRF